MTDTEYAITIYCQLYKVDSDNGDVHVRGVLDAIDELDEQHRIALESYFRNGNTYAKTGEILGVKKDAATSIIFKALWRLRSPSIMRNMSVKAIIEHRDKKLDDATNMIEELYRQIERLLQGGNVSRKINAVLESRKESVADLGLSSRICSILHRADIRTVEALMQPSALDNLLTEPGFGKKSYEDIISKMRERGYSEWADQMDFKHTTNHRGFMGEPLYRPEAITVNEHIAVLGLPELTFRALTRAGAHSIGDLVAYDYERLVKTHNIGQVGYTAILSTMRSSGYNEWVDKVISGEREFGWRWIKSFD